MPTTDRPAYTPTPPPPPPPGARRYEHAEDATATPPPPADRRATADGPPDLPPPPSPTVARPGAAGSRAAAWVTGTGAFLLVAAAAVFVGVRWSAMPLELKVAIVGGVTGGVLALGAKLQKQLPIAGRTLLHLGAFLLPVDVGALASRLEASQAATALAEGAVITVAFPLLAKLADSRTLRWLSLTGPIVLATGVGATVGVPAPILLAVGAAVALAVARASSDRDDATATTDVERGAVAIATATVGLHLLGEAFAALPGLPFLLTEAGWSRGVSVTLIAAPALLATAVVAVAALSTRSRRTANLALLLPFVGLTTVLVSRTGGPLVDLLALPLAFVVVEVAALAAAKDPLWDGPTTVFATILEFSALVATLPAAGVLLWTAVSENDPSGWFTMSADADWAAAFGVAALGAVISAVRRTRPGRHMDARATVTATVLAAAAGAFAYATIPLPLAILALGALVLALRGDAVGVLGAAAVALLAVVIAFDHPNLTVATAALTGVVALVGLGSYGRRDDVITPVLGTLTIGLTLAGLTVALMTGASELPLQVTIPAAVAVALLVSYAIGGRGMSLGHGPERILIPADVARAVVPLASLAIAGSSLSQSGRVVALAAVAVIAIADAVTERRVVPTVVAAVPLHHLGIVAALDAGVSSPVIGLGLVVVGALWAAAAVAGELRGADRTWTLTFGGISGLATFTGWMLAGQEQITGGAATIATGAIVILVGLAVRSFAVAHVGGLIATLGTWILLEAADVEVIELYVLPVAAQLIALGAQVRSRDVELSSWLAYAPGLMLFIVPAVIERADDGSGWHAVAAGAVAVGAVAVGGFRRLGAPLVLGVATLVVLTLVEALAVVAAVPTWVWLALGGSTLLGTGILLERAGTSPVAAGRRLVATVNDRFV